MQIWTLLTLGCFLGGGGSGEPAGDDGVVDAATDADAPEDSVDCPEGTTAEASTNATGREVWCDRDGVMHGPYLRTYSNGEKAAQGAHDTNLTHGSWIWWHENGQEKSKGKYNKGKQTGSWTWWHDNGNPQEEGDFLQGRKAGHWIKWFDTGMKQSEGLYHNGMKNGKWTYYNDDEENTVARYEQWKNGEMSKETVVNDKSAQK